MCVSPAKSKRQREAPLGEIFIVCCYKNKVQTEVVGWLATQCGSWGWSAPKSMPSSSGAHITRECDPPTFFSFAALCENTAKWKCLNLDLGESAANKKKAGEARRVVVNIFIFRNSWKIHSDGCFRFFLAHSCTSRAHTSVAGRSVLDGNWIRVEIDVYADRFYLCTLRGVEEEDKARRANLTSSRKDL